MQAIGFHTVEDRDNPDEVEDNGPFLSAGSISFLGTGYYFWEDNIELAHWWGNTHCNREYIICQGDLACDDSLYLDIHGKVKDQKYLRSIQLTLREELLREFKNENIPLGALIEYLKRLENQPHRKGIFPFKVIRAVDSSKHSENMAQFVSNKPNWTDLAPRIMICLIERSKLILTGFRIIFPEKYVV